MKTMARIGTIVLLLTGLACGESPVDVSAGELVADPAIYEGQRLHVVGSPDGAGFQNLMFCEDPGPCNNHWGRYYYSSPTGELLYLEPADPGEWTILAKGHTPQRCFDATCDEGTTFGCHGNDTEAFCAPAIPARITGATGRLEGNVFYVESLDLADAPRDEGIYHEVE